MISSGTLILTLLVVVLLAGTKKLRNVGEDLGAAVRGFRKGMEGEETKKDKPE